MAAPETTGNQEDSKPVSWLEFQVVHDGNNDANDANDNNNTFTCFPALPAELRLQIWECLIQPRTVLVACINPRSQHRRRAQLLRRPKRPATPVLLQVNRETRTLALRHYELAFSWEIPRSWGQLRAFMPSARNARVWFNFDLDALFILASLHARTPRGHAIPMLYSLPYKDLQRVRHVSCTFGAVRRNVFGMKQHPSLLTTFPSTQRFLITTTQREIAKLTRTSPDGDVNLHLVWTEFLEGSTDVPFDMFGKRAVMIREDDLAGVIAADQ